jgi:hypothetical protein
MAAYPKPNNTTGTFNNQNFVSPDTGGLTIDEAKQYFVTFPNTQSPSTIIANNFNTTGSLNVAGDSQFGGDVTFIGGVNISGEIVFENDVEVTGTTTLDDNLLCLTTATITDLLTCQGGIDITTLGDGVTFPDNTTQTTAFIEANYAQLNTDNTFLPTFTNNFNGPVNLNDVTNGVTPLTGDNSTLLATTEFVQNAVSVSGVQVTDSPLLWSGANTNQYNAGTGSTLTYSYPYGLSQLYNLSGGNEEFSLVANNGLAGPEDNAFRIYCTQGNKTGTQLQGTTPQLILSNNGTAMFVKDGINVNAQNIIGIGALAGNGGNISCNSNFLIGAGNSLNMQTNNIINCNSITDTSGQYVTTNTPPDNTVTTAIATTGYVATAISNIPPPVLTGYAVLNQGGIQNWLGNNTCSNGIWDYTTNSTVLVQTVANTTNNNTVASTAFVKANAGIYTQTSITATSSIYYSINPSTVNVITTYTSANNVVSFNSVNFNIVIGTVPTFLQAQLNFSASPFSGAPPSPNQQNITMFCSNGATYLGTVSWLNATSIYIGPPAGISLSSGMTFTVNLSTLGAFTP